MAWANFCHPGQRLVLHVGNFSKRQAISSEYTDSHAGRLSMRGDRVEHRTFCHSTSLGQPELQATSRSKPILKDERLGSPSAHCVAARRTVKAARSGNTVNVHTSDLNADRTIAIGPLKVYIQSYAGDVFMRYSTQIKPISYLKANAAEVLDELNEQRKPLIITQNGEAKAVLQDVASYEETQETMALLKILALGNKQIAEGKVKPVADVVKRLRGQKVSD
jgi:prevent-host-death family protein